MYSYSDMIKDLLKIFCSVSNTYRKCIPALGLLFDIIDEFEWPRPLSTTKKVLCLPLESGSLCCRQCQHTKCIQFIQKNTVPNQKRIFSRNILFHSFRKSLAVLYSLFFDYCLTLSIFLLKINIFKDIEIYLKK